MKNRVIKYFSVVYLFLAGVELLTAQDTYDKNYVPNGSFENAKRKSESIKAAVPWNQIASVDYYQEPIRNDTTAQKGARTGNCYAGLRYQKKYKEFMQVKLAEPLHRGYKYQFEMYIRLAFWSNATIKSIGAHFSKAGYQGVHTLTKYNVVDSVCKKGGFFNHYRWIKISGIYNADGGEKYITIGNFAENVRKDMVKDNVLKLGFKESYYFVDDISLKRIKEKEPEVKTIIVGSTLDEVPADSVLQVKNDVKVGDVIELKNIHFEHGKSYIVPESYIELNKLVQYLFKHPNMEIRINGHTDASGPGFKNQKIAEQRARVVFEYLIGKGVQNKMYFKGFGSKQPIASNDTEEGRAKNRRVEIEIIKS